MNYGHGITIATVLFILFILSFVYRAFHQDFDLVTENYYEKEIAYQGRINQMENSKHLVQNITWEKIANGIEVKFPEMNYQNIAGTIKMMRPSDKKMDINLPISLTTEGKQTIASEKLNAGKYELQIEWELGGKQYYFESVVVI